MCAWPARRGRRQFRRGDTVSDVRSHGHDDVERVDDDLDVLDPDPDVLEPPDGRLASRARRSRW